MKKLITLLFAILALALISCNSETPVAEKAIKDTLVLKVDTTVKKIEVAKVDTCKKVAVPVKKVSAPVKKKK